MYLINAIYFKGTWSYQFDKEYTRADYFYQTRENRLDCQMMTISGSWLYYQDDDLQIIDLPYGDSLFCMTVFLPAANRSINDFITGLNPEQWNAYIHSLKREFGTLSMPKIKIKYKLLMNDVLNALGMGIAFSGAADFSRINGFGGLFISRVIHQSFVQVDEEGTEAAAATIVEVWESSGGGPTGFGMHVDRPYFFIIRERTNNTILFMGKIIDPQWQDN